MNEKEIQYYTQPRSYGHWLKQALMLPLPLRKDFDGLGEALMDVGGVILTMIFRLFVLLTLPVSAPVLAYVLVVAERKVVAKNKAAIEEIMGNRDRLRQLQKEQL